jgi:hypothetical protein
MPLAIPSLLLPNLKLFAAVERDCFHGAADSRSVTPSATIGWSDPAGSQQFRIGAASLEFGEIQVGE